MEKSEFILNSRYANIGGEIYYVRFSKNENFTCEIWKYKGLSVPPAYGIESDLKFSRNTIADLYEEYKKILSDPDLFKEYKKFK